MSKDQWTEIVAKTDSEAWDRQNPIEGVYVKRQENIGPNESMLYTLRTTDGDVSIWGSTVLDTKFAEIEIGCMVRIEPLEKVKSEKTGREYQDYKVLWKPFEGFEEGDGYAKAKEVAARLRGRNDPDDDSMPEMPPDWLMRGESEREDEPERN